MIYIDIADTALLVPDEVLGLAGSGDQGELVAYLMAQYPNIVSEIASIPGLREWLQEWNVGDMEADDYCAQLSDGDAVGFALWVGACNAAELNAELDRLSE